MKRIAPALILAGAAANIGLGYRVVMPADWVTACRMNENGWLSSLL